MRDRFGGLVQLGIGDWLGSTFTAETIACCGPDPRSRQNGLIDLLRFKLMKLQVDETLGGELFVLV